MPSDRTTRARKPTLFPRLTDPGFLAQAFRHVAAHYTKDNLPPALQEFDRRRAARLESLAERLRTQTFFPQPAALLYIPKPNHPGERRPISLLDLEDRIVLTALNTLLYPIVDRLLLPGCFAYRARRAAGAAIEAVHRHIAAGCSHVATGDLDNFFAAINRDRLLDLIRRRVWETPVHNLLEAFLHIGAQSSLEWQDTGLGIAQGSPLSPLLSNLYLADFDQLLQRAAAASPSDASTLTWSRYADNILLLSNAPPRLRDTWQQAAQYIESECHLRFNSGSVLITTAEVYWSGWGGQARGGK